MINELPGVCFVRRQTPLSWLSGLSKIGKSEAIRGVGSLRLKTYLQ